MKPTKNLSPAWRRAICLVTGLSEEIISRKATYTNVGDDINVFLGDKVLGSVTLEDMQFAEKNVNGAKQMENKIIKTLTFWSGLGCTLKGVRPGKITVYDDILKKEFQVDENWSLVRIYKELHKLRKGWMQR